LKVEADFFLSKDNIILQHKDRNNLNSHVRVVVTLLQTDRAEVLASVLHRLMHQDRWRRSPGASTFGVLMPANQLGQLPQTNRQHLKFARSLGFAGFADLQQQ
jgi:hypothetical protein